MGTHRRRPAGLPRHPRPAQGRSRAAATRPGPARPAEFATCPGEEGEVLEQPKPACSRGSSRAAGLRGLPELGRPSGTSPVPAGQQSLIKGKGSAAGAPGPASQAPEGPGRGTKGPGTERRRWRPADLTAPGSSSAPAAGLGRPDPRAGPARRRRRALPPALPAAHLPRLVVPKQLRSRSKAGRGQSQARPRPSSSQEAAGRAGRARQAAQEKPRLVPPLPPRGPGDKEARGPPERRQPARGPDPPHHPRRARARLLRPCGSQPGPRAAAGGSGERPRPSPAGRGAGGGSTGRRAGRLAEAAPAEAERTRPGRPARGHLGRCGGRRRSGAGRRRGRRAPADGRTGGRAGGYGSPPAAGLAALSIRARRRQLVRARSARLARRRLLRSPAASTEATVSVLGSPPPRPRVGPEDERPERFPPAAAASLGSPARRYRPGADGTRASWRPPAEPREDFQLFLLWLVVTSPPIVTPIRLLFH